MENLTNLSHTKRTLKTCQNNKVYSQHDSVKILDILQKSVRHIKVSLKCGEAVVLKHQDNYGQNTISVHGTKPPDD